MHGSHKPVHYDGIYVFAMDYSCICPAPFICMTQAHVWMPQTSALRGRKFARAASHLPPIAFTD